MLEIRQAVSNDLDLLTDWTHSLYLHEDDGRVASHPELKSRLRNWLSTELSSGNGLFLIAQKDDAAVGFIFASSVLNDNGFLTTPIKGVIHLLWVDEKFRNYKIGQTLAHAIEACFKEMSISYIECSYTVKNQLAEKFWNQLDYSPNSITARKMLE